MNLVLKVESRTYIGAKPDEKINEDNEYLFNLIINVMQQAA